MRISTRVKELLDALEHVEWSGMIWGDDPVCPFCYNLQAGLPAIRMYPAQPAATHKDDCEWLRLMVLWGRRESRGLIQVSPKGHVGSKD